MIHKLFGKCCCFPFCLRVACSTPAPTLSSCFPLKWKKQNREATLGSNTGSPNRKAIRNAISPKSEVTIGTQWEAIFSGDDGAGGDDDAGGCLLGLDHTVRARFLCTAMSDEPLRSSRFARTHRLHSQSAFLPFVLRRRTPLRVVPAEMSRWLRERISRWMAPPRACSRSLCAWAYRLVQTVGS